MTTAPGRAAARPDLARHRRAFWLVAAAFAATMSFTTVPTPMYGLYQARDGFPTLMITVIFAAYGFGVMGGLYLAGHVSDYLGRRSGLLTSVVLALIVVPLRFPGAWPPSALSIATQLFAHIVLVGLPTAFIARKYLRG